LPLQAVWTPQTSPLRKPKPTVPATSGPASNPVRPRRFSRAHSPYRSGEVQQLLRPFGQRKQAMETVHGERAGPGVGQLVPHPDQALRGHLDRTGQFEAGLGVRRPDLDEPAARRPAAVRAAAPDPDRTGQREPRRQPGAVPRAGQGRAAEPALPLARHQRERFAAALAEGGGEVQRGLVVERGRVGRSRTGPRAGGGRRAAEPGPGLVPIAGLVPIPGPAPIADLGIGRVRTGGPNRRRVRTRRPGDAGVGAPVQHPRQPGPREVEHQVCAFGGQDG
jgi:hypothetical protein